MKCVRCEGCRTGSLAPRFWVLRPEFRPIIRTMPIAVGSRFGECEVLAALGAGGMGEVYRARDNLGREVALKVLPEQVTSDPDRLRRFEQEGRAAAALSHPNILAVYSFGTTDQRVPYLVT